MKSKPFGKEQVRTDHVNGNKSFEFIKLYKSAVDTKESHIETNKSSKKVKKIFKNSQTELETSKKSRSAKKRAEKNVIDLSKLEAIEHNSSNIRSLKKSNLAPTFNDNSEHSANGVKSIMKNNQGVVDSLQNISNVNATNSKPKKRSKSVSFMIEDTNDIIVKKSKSDDSSKEQKHQNIEFKKSGKSTNSKKGQQQNWSKENNNLNDVNIKSVTKENFTTDSLNKDLVREPTLGIPIIGELASGEKKKVKKAKKSKPEIEESVEINEDNVPGEQSSKNKSKRLKKKKRKAKSMQDSYTQEEGEPAIKIQKKDVKPEAIAKGLENLNIGDNAHTLTNLLDEMTVVDKNKKKKDRQKLKKQKLKKSNGAANEQRPQQDKNIEKEKVKWNNRKWNKDTKGDVELRLQTSVVVENLPIKIMCNYKTLLSEHFGKFGTITGIGVAEAYPTEDPKPVFTTTVFFQEEDAATKALEDDNTELNGSRIRVRRPLPRTETTLVVHAYSLTDQALSSLFSAAGRIRAIRQLIKGKKTIPTAFVEFDGPEAVERALKLAEDAKINGKKMYVSKFENRKKGTHVRSAQNVLNENDNDSCSE